MYLIHFYNFGTIKEAQDLDAAEIYCRSVCFCAAIFEKSGKLVANFNSVNQSFTRFA